MTMRPQAVVIVVLLGTISTFFDQNTQLWPAAAAQTETAESEKVRIWKQVPELQPGVTPSAVPVPEINTPPEISEADFQKGPVPKWIWGEDNDKNYVLQVRFRVESVETALLRASCDNVGSVFVNGRQVASSSEWQEPMSAIVTKTLVPGENVIEAEVSNQGGVAAFVLKLAWHDAQGGVHHMVSDSTWKVVTKRNDSQGEAVSLRGNLGDGPWGNALTGDTSGRRVPAGVFEVLPGFQVEKLFTVPKEELGSWVCITFDQKGRLLASDQGDLGICRITLPAVSATGGTDPSGKAEVTETIVERLDFSKCAVKPTAAHGMLWAFDALYLSINGGPGSGLYRARDPDGDGQFDECVKLSEFRGGGEHGPHALRLSPDGQRIFVICGNHTKPPFQPGDELSHPEFTSRIPTNWGEDHLLPRMWDANGHARGVLAPGGWIASTDPDGKTWDIFSIGYRNPYDMAFNADGELFAYDADMEWDMGMPWYRPTRVVHATSGSEFGWRSGSGKWPSHYPDNLPPLVNIGPGSPVGVEFGYGLKFPEKYQKALYLCDWTFGTMYAIHMTPNGSSYTATKEEFLSRTPLPLTGVAAGPDGALYFSVGGRGTQSELFRVIYTGSESVAAATLTSQEFAEQRKLRHKVEQLHGRPLPLQSFLEAISEVKIPIGQSDRHLEYALQVAAMHVPFEQISVIASFFPDMGTQLAEGQEIYSRAVSDQLTMVRLLAKRSPATRGLSVDADQKRDDMLTAGRAFEMLEEIRPEKLTDDVFLEYLRSVSLVMIRLADPDEATRLQLLEKLDPLFPSKNSVVNRELVQMLTYLESASVIEKTVALMQQPPQPTIDQGLEALIARNRGYGGSISSMLTNAPDQEQIWYAFVLRNAKKGWTIEQRRAWFSWFEGAQQWSGGASYKGFLKNIEREAFENATENERILIEAGGARKPFAMPELPKPAGPGRNWTLDEVRAIAETGLKDRDFERGKTMFAATRCILCHRFAGDGGATGPDLTQLAGRFNLRDLTEAIMDPNKVISDQYKGSVIVTTGGKTLQGRIVSESETAVTVLTDPEDSTKIAEIPKSEIDEISAASVSMMPQDLLKTLNQDEVLDLLAYLLSRGDDRNPMFRRPR